MKKYILMLAAALAINNVSQAQENKKDLEVVAELPVRPANAAVSKDGRIFATIHPLGSNDLQLIEITGKKLSNLIQMKVFSVMEKLQLTKH